MLIKEFRIIMPLDVFEYKIGQLYCVTKFSKENTGGGEGVEILKNEPFEGKPLLENDFAQGQFTYKIFHLDHKLPWWITKLAPKGSRHVVEKSWNAFPYCRTILSPPDGMKDYFYIKVETIHLSDRGTTPNAHRLSNEVLSKREVITIDIANDPTNASEYRKEEDPKLFKSKKTGRGPLVRNWMNEVNPVMTCYKLVTAEFHCRGIQTKLENFIMEVEKQLFTNFHRQLFCSIDSWYGLTIEDIRVIEEDARKELNKQIHDYQLRGRKIID